MFFPNDIWEDSGEIGLFIPAYIVNTDFKDENGNTDIERALITAGTTGVTVEDIIKPK